MMKKYIFKSWNDNWDYVYDIQGESFRKLIETCGKYCEYVSFWYFHANDEKRQHYSELAPFLTQTPEWGKKFSVPYSYDPSGHSDIAVRSYKVCPELLETMLKISDKMFTWLDGWVCGNPEDPTFYRSDGSVFLDTIVHDSQCVLSPREGEDVKDILSAETWEEYEGPFPLKIVPDNWWTVLKHDR